MEKTQTKTTTEGTPAPEKESTEEETASDGSETEEEICGISSQADTVLLDLDDCILFTSKEDDALMHYMHLMSCPRCSGNHSVEEAKAYLFET